MGLIHSEKERLTFFLVEVVDLILDGLKHAGLAALVRNTEDFAELSVKLRDADGGKADIVHMEKVRIQGLSEGTEREGFTHAGTGSEDGNATDIFEVVETALNRSEVMGLKKVFDLEFLLIKGVKAKAEIVQKRIHERPPEWKLE